MKKNYDFSKAVKNPYAKRLKRLLTLELDVDTIAYFQDMAKHLAIPYQTLMNRYLRKCVRIPGRVYLFIGNQRPNNVKPDFEQTFVY